MLPSFIKASLLAPSSTRHLTDDDIKLVEEAIKLADSQKRGFLIKSELKIAMVVIFGYKPSKYEVEEYLRKIGKPRSKYDEDNVSVHLNESELVIDSSAFKDLMLQKLKHSDVNDDIREGFLAFDSRCKGFIDVGDFKKIVKKYMPHLDDYNAERLFREVDQDADGRVSFRDFELMMKHSL